MSGTDDPNPWSRFELLASAIAGQALHVGVGEEALSYTTGTAILLPRDLPEADARRATIVQAALIAAGSLDPSLVRELRHRSGLARRYLEVEVPRALAEVGQRVPAARALGSTTAPATTTDAFASLARARRLRGSAAPPVWFGAIRPGRIAPPEDLTVRGLQPSRPAGEQEEVGDEADEVPSPPSLFESPGGEGVFARLIRRSRLQRGRSTSGNGATEAVLGRQGRGPSSTLVGLEAPSPVELAAEGPAGAGWRFPEWDERVGRHRPEWCTVRVQAAVADPDPQGIARVEPNPAIRRAVAQLGRGLQAVRRRPSGAEVDLDAYVDARCTLAGGGDPGDAMYLELTRTQRDLGVVVLLDVSGSVAGSDRERISTHRAQQITAAALVEAFQSVGDRVTAYGFRSRGRHAVDLLQWKAFDERLSTSMLRLSGLEPAGFTRLGAAIRAGTHIAATQAGTPQRLLVIISDGIAFDGGYEGRHARSDCRHAIQEAREVQVGTVCISVKAPTDPSVLEGVFGASAFVSAEGLEEVSDVLGPLLRRALAGVAV